MTGVRHSYHFEGSPGGSGVEYFAKQYITSQQQRRRMSQPISPSSGLDESDLARSTSPRRKKKKGKEGKRRNSRPRGKGDLASDDIDGGSNYIGSNLVSPRPRSSSPKKKKKGKKDLGCMIIPDCCEIRNDESARFSAVTDPTQLLDEDDFTASTKDASTKDDKKHFLPLPKTPKALKKKEKSRAKTPDKKRSKTPDKKRSKSPKKASRRSSLPVEERQNEAWGDDPTGNKSYISASLLDLLVGPETKPPSHDTDQLGTMPLRKSHSFESSLEGSAHMRQKNNSYQIPHMSPPLNNRKKTLRSKSIEDPALVDSKNATWGEMRGRRGSNPYTAERPDRPPSMRRNVKSFGSVESWKNDPKRDRDIPAFLFISNDAPKQPGFNEPWDGRSSSRQLDRPSSRMLRKDIINGERPPSMRARSAGAATRRRRASATTPKVEKPPQPLRKKELRRGSAGNATWEADPRLLGTSKVPLSPGLVDILGVSPATPKRTKSPGRFKSKLTTSAPLSSLKNNLKKLRGGRPNEMTLRAVPML